jgi:hypothetical protein
MRLCEVHLWSAIAALHRTRELYLFDWNVEIVRADKALKVGLPHVLHERRALGQGYVSPALPAAILEENPDVWFHHHSLPTKTPHMKASMRKAATVIKSIFIPRPSILAVTSATRNEQQARLRARLRARSPVATPG